MKIYTVGRLPDPRKYISKFCLNISESKQRHAMAELMQAVEFTEGKKCADVEKIAKTSFGSVLIDSLTAKPILINIHVPSKQSLNSG